MMTFYIILLLVLGALFLMAEIVLLPGVTIGTILSLACYAGAIYLGFAFFGTTIGIVVIVAALLLSLLTVIFSLRAKTWQRFSLKQELTDTSMPTPEAQLTVGQRGTTLSRLAPMGKVEIAGVIYEAKSLDSFIDQRTTIEVVGFENFSVLVKRVQ